MRRQLQGRPLNHKASPVSPEVERALDRHCRNAAPLAAGHNAPDLSSESHLLGAASMLAVGPVLTGGRNLFCLTKLGFCAP